MHNFILPIVAVFALCEAANIVKRNEGCGELMKCRAPLDSFESSDVSRVTALSDDDEYDQLCQANTEFQSCFGDKIQFCDDPTEISTITGTADVLDYICTPEGKEDFKKIVDSPCVTDQTTLLAAQESMGECVENFQMEFQMAMFQAIFSGEDAQSVNVCPFVDQLKSCIMTSLTNHCGNDFGSFAEKLWEMSFSQVAEQIGCDVKAKQIRHLKTRILPLVLAGAKRRR